MFFNENQIRFGGNIGTINKLENGCLRFGVCQTTSTLVNEEWVDSTNWLNVLFTKKQTEIFANQIKTGDEILLEGELRIGKYNGHPTVTMFVKKIIGHVPSETRTLANIYRKSNDQAKAVLVDQNVMSQLVQGVPALAVQQPVPQAQQPVPQAQTLTPEMMAMFQSFLAQNEKQQTAHEPQAQQPVQMNPTSNVNQELQAYASKSGYLGG